MNRNQQIRWCVIGIWLILGLMNLVIWLNTPMKSAFGMCLIGFMFGGAFILFIDMSLMRLQEQLTDLWRDGYINLVKMLNKAHKEAVADIKKKSKRGRKKRG